MPTNKRILVPVDFSKPSLRAVEVALELAERLAAEVVLLHVVEPVYYPAAGEVYGIGFEFGDIYVAIERAARSQLKKLTAKVRARHAATRDLLLVGTAHRTIVEQAKKLRADLIVLSTHGRTGLSHVVLGSVAERVVRTATCPVLTVPLRGAKPAPRTRTLRPLRAPAKPAKPAKPPAKRRAAAAS
jgi:nucleotide-binding universal stress UspA family protein